MKMLKKLALVSAVSMISAGAFAMEAMDDESMSATTGQDGVTINIVPDVIARTNGVNGATDMGVTTTTLDLINSGSLVYKGLSIGEIRVHDNDGMTGNTTSGALVIGGGYDKNNDGDFLDAGETTVMKDRTVIIAKGDKPIQINLDMVGDANSTTAGSQPMLNVEIKQPKMAIKLGNIYVADSYNAGLNGVNNSTANTGALTGDDADNAGAVDGNAIRGKVKILDGLEIVMNESTMTIQLGNETQGSMIKADAILGGGLTINNFALYDQQGADPLNADNLLTGTVGSGGNFRASSIKITDNGGVDLSTKTSIDFGSRITVSTVTPGGAAETAFKNAQAVKAGAADYASASAGVKAAVDAITATATGFANGAADGVNTLTETNTWGGIDTYNGLVLTTEAGNAGGIDIAINNAAVGDDLAANIGDVQIIGLMLGKSKIVIMGH